MDHLPLRAEDVLIDPSLCAFDDESVRDPTANVCAFDSDTSNARNTDNSIDLNSIVWPTERQCFVAYVLGALDKVFNDSKRSLLVLIGFNLRLFLIWHRSS